MGTSCLSKKGYMKVPRPTFTKECPHCRKKFTVPYHWRGRKYCCHSCSLHHHRGNNHPYWKDDGFSYSAVHNWLHRWAEKPDVCQKCGARPKKLEWCNVDGKYRRVLDDYICLCTSCHRKYDLTPEKKKQAISILPWYKKKHEK